MSGSGTPLLSVVIPTYKRPGFLGRAIESALLAAPEKDAEVIVVPNGPDESWKIAAEAYKFESRVQWHPVPEAHANVARNYGKRLSSGKYLRFLDDDDFLFPAAAEQLSLLDATSAEVCSGRIENVEEGGTSHGLLSFPDTNDFVCAAVSFSGFALPTGHVFLRSLLKDVAWDVALNRRQDYAWLLELAMTKEWNWASLDKPVGAWFQHRGNRISHDKFMAEREQPVIDKLLRLHEELGCRNRLDPARNEAIANALWHHAHLGFPYHPRYWSGIARQAQSIFPDASPPHSFFWPKWMWAIDPLAREWVLLPARKVARAARTLVAATRGTKHKRNL